MWMILDDTSRVRDTDQDAYQPQPESGALISELRDRIGCDIGAYERQGPS